MRIKKLRKITIPFIVATGGIVLSMLVCFLLLTEVHPTHIKHPVLETYHPWLVLAIGSLLSLIIGWIVYANRASQEQARLLKKEMAIRLAAEKTKHQLEAALVEGQKLQAIGTLAGGIAHDFNNILYAIQGYLDLALKETAKTSPLHFTLEKTREATHRGQALVSRILSFSREQHGEFDVIDLTCILRTIIVLLTPSIPTRINIVFDAIEEDLFIFGDQTELHRVFINLIHNAVDAIENEGTIEIIMKKIAAYKVPKSIQKAHGYCQIDIKDSGCGIRKNIADRIFEPFFTTKEVGKGTGLGLSITRTIIQAHGGEIQVISQYNHGSVFTIILPLYEHGSDKNG